MKKLTLLLTVCGLIGAQSLFSAEVASINGIPIANIASINGTPIANIASANGLTVPSGGGPDPTLVFEWHMEDLNVTAGTPAGSSDGDTSGAANQLAAISSVQAQDGGNSLSIPTSNDWIDFTVASQDIANGTEGRIEFYVYVTTIANTGSLLSMINGVDAISIRMRTDFVDMQYNNSGSPDPSVATVAGSLTTGSWHHIVARWRSSGSPNLSISINGATAVTSDTDPGAAVSPTTLRFGQGGTSGVYFLDNVKIYNAWGS